MAVRPAAQAPPAVRGDVVTGRQEHGVRDATSAELRRGDQVGVPRAAGGLGQHQVTGEPFLEPAGDPGMVDPSLPVESEQDVLTEGRVPVGARRVTDQPCELQPSRGSS